VFHHNCCVSISVRWIHSIVEAATATRSRRCRNASFPAGVES